MLDTHNTKHTRGVGKRKDVPNTKKTTAKRQNLVRRILSPWFFVVNRLVSVLTSMSSTSSKPDAGQLAKRRSRNDDFLVSDEKHSGSDSNKRHKPNDKNGLY
jgi:hypothetical protein